MPGYVMHVGATMTCPHLSVVTVPPSHGVPRVLLDYLGPAMPAAVMNPPFPVLACPNPDKKCTVVQWVMASTRVTVMGRPLMLQSAPGAPGGAMCDSAPPAPPLKVEVQSIRVVAM